VVWKKEFFDKNYGGGKEFVSCREEIKIGFLSAGE